MNEEHLQISELLLLQRVSQRINSILDLEMLLEEVVGDVVQTFGYTRSGILLKDEQTNELEIVAVRGWTVNYHIKGDRFKIGEYGIIGHVGLTEELYYAPDVTKDQFYKVSEHSTRSELDIPLKTHGHFIGVFNFQHQDYDAFSPSRIQLLQALAAHVSTAIENARLFQSIRKEKDRLSGELEEARNVQFSLFPGRTPVIQGFNISGICVPCREVGGDWFDYISLSNGNIAVVLADVSGKGPGAALLMSSTRSIVRMFAERDLSPGEILYNVNKSLIKDLPKTRFVTMIYAVIPSGGKKIVFANAGHLPPAISDPDGVRMLEYDSGLPLGITESDFPEHTIIMNPGSRLLLYSDGITEAMNSKEEQYGDERILERFNNSAMSVNDLVDNVQNFIKGTPVMDDMTVVMINSI